MRGVYQSISPEKEKEYEKDMGLVHMMITKGMNQGAMPMEHRNIEDLQKKYDAPVDDFYINHKIYTDRICDKVSSQSNSFMFRGEL